MIQKSREPDVKEKEWIGNTEVPSRNGFGINSTAEDDQTALNFAIRKGDVETVRMLLDKGANMNKSDTNGWTPKALAEQLGSKSIYDLLLRYEKRVSSDEHKIEFLAKSSSNTRNDQSKATTFNCSNSHVNKSLFFCSSSMNHPADPQVVKLNNRRVTIHMKFIKNNASQTPGGKLILLPDSIEELFRIAGKLGSTM